MMKNIERIIEDTIAKYREDVFNPRAALDNYLSSRNIRHFNVWIAAVAAVIAILILTPFFIGQYSVTEYTAQDTSRALVLPDGSSVLLSQGSVLSLSRRGFRKSRTVNLEGRAIFDVIHDTEKPFTVSTGNALVKDVGTEFQVYKHKGGVDVDVFSGEVIFSSVAYPEASLCLTEGMHAVLANSTGRPTLSDTGIINPKAWADGRFVYSDTELVKVLKDLECCFGTALSSSDTTAVLTGTFEAASLEEIVRIISLALDVEIKIEEK